MTELLLLVMTMKMTMLSIILPVLMTIHLSLQNWMLWPSQYQFLQKKKERKLHCKVNGCVFRGSNSNIFILTPLSVAPLAAKEGLNLKERICSSKRKEFAPGAANSFLED